MSASNLEIGYPLRDNTWTKIDYDPSKVAYAVYNRLTRCAYWATRFDSPCEAGSQLAADMQKEVDAFAVDPWPYIGNEYSRAVLPYTHEALAAWAAEQDRIPYSAKPPRRRRKTA